MLYLYLYVDHMSVSQSLPQYCLGWDSEGARTSLKADPSINFCWQAKMSECKTDIW